MIFHTHIQIIIQHFTPSHVNAHVHSPVICIVYKELQYKTKSDQTLQQVDELLLETTVWTLEKNDTTVCLTLLLLNVLGEKAAFGRLHP